MTLSVLCVYLYSAQSFVASAHNQPAACDDLQLQLNFNLCFAALANIAGDGPNARDTVLAAGAMQVARFAWFAVVSHLRNCSTPALAQASRSNCRSSVHVAQLHVADEQLGSVFCSIFVRTPFLLRLILSVVSSRLLRLQP